MTDTPTSTTDYLAGYEQGRHDGIQPSPNEAEADMRPSTGNQIRDDGYADGFHRGRELQRQQAIGRWAIALAQAVRLHRLARWINARQEEPAVPAGPAAHG